MMLSLIYLILGLIPFVAFLQVGTHDKLGMQIVPLREIIPRETKQFTLNLVKNTNPNDPQNKKYRGQLEVELTLKPFKENSQRFSGPLDGSLTDEENNNVGKSYSKAGLLMVSVQGAEDVEGKHHNNPYALVCFGGERKKTKVIL